MKRRFVITDIDWTLDRFQEGSGVRYPKAHEIGTTAYREHLGPDDLFSVYIKFILQEGQESAVCKRAKIYALVPAMDERLPHVGQRLIITSGFKPVAECVVFEQGEEESS